MQSINLDKSLPFGRSNRVVHKINPKTTALLVVDMQKFFLEPGAPAYIVGGGLSPSGKDTILRAKKVVDYSRQKGIIVLWSMWGLRKDGRDTGLWKNKFPTWWGPKSPNGPEWGDPLINIVDELKPRPDEVVFQKTRYSSFYETPLDTWLRGKGIDTLIVIGVTTGFCVRYTVADAFNRNYKTVVLADCTSAINDPSCVAEGDKQYLAALADFQIGLADVLTSDEFMNLPIEGS